MPKGKKRTTRPLEAAPTNTRYAPIPSTPSSPLGSGSTTPAHDRSPRLSPIDSRDVSCRIGEARQSRKTPLREIDEAVIVAEGEDTVTMFVWVLVCSAAISGLLFGYDTGVISGTLVIVGSDLGTTLSDWRKEMITSATTLGALAGGLAAGAMSDYTGRKSVITIANVIFIAGAMCQAACHTVPSMIFGRLVVGLGVGLASCIVPLYIGELAPTKIRGRLVTVNVVAITLGQVLAYGTLSKKDTADQPAIGAAFTRVPNGWRYMVGFGGVPALVQLVSLMYLPESPRILLLQSKTKSARSVLSKIYPLATEHQLDLKIQVMDTAVRQSVAISGSTTFSDRVASLVHVGMNRRALIIGCGLQAAQQLCGFNTLMYYSASIFSMLGFHNATAVGLIIAGVNFIFTLVALKIVDPLGRRRTMLSTMPMMVVALVMAAIFFHYLTLDTGGVLRDGEDYSPRLSALVLLSMVLYVAAYATGLGNIPWQQGELFRLEVRGIGTSICTATNWSCNLLIAATFLSLMRVASPAGAFAIYAAFCAAGWVFCYLLYPETSGLSLEEVYFVFEDGFGVAKSYELRREKTHVAEQARLLDDSA
ncbi:MFS transporter, SP family, solute carrier family 2 (myo-inositol transporter), member 13, partial [Tremellales sp. Uapishka_1]